MAKKAKWLEEGTEVELLEVVLGVLGGELDKKEINKATKAIEELIERAPTGEEEGLSVEDSIEALKELFTTGIENITFAYNAELEAISGDTSDEDDEDDTEEDDDAAEEGNDYDEMTLKELKAECKEKGIKGLKGLKKEDLIALLTETEDEAEDDEEDEDSEEAEDYSEISQKELKEMCRERGIKVTKAMKKADFIKALEADDAE